jgi:hypothetical protein
VPLSETQRRVATLVLSLPEAEGFALAGGAALILHGVTDRDTRDLDCFVPPRSRPSTGSQRRLFEYCARSASGLT